MKLMLGLLPLKRLTARAYRLYARQQLRDRMSMIITIDRSGTARSIATSN